MSVKAKLVTAIAAVALPVSAFSAVLDFDSMPSAGVHTGPYSEDGFTFELRHGVGAWEPHYEAGADNLRWHDDGANGDNVLNYLTHSSLSAFDFTSFDLVSGALSLKAYSQVGVMDFGILSTAGTYAFNLTNITALVFDVIGNGGPGGIGEVAIDNVVASVANVPEPATLALFGLGLAGLGVSRSRRA